MFPGPDRRASAREGEQTEQRRGEHRSRSERTGRSAEEDDAHALQRSMYRDGASAPGRDHRNDTRVSLSNAAVRRALTIFLSFLSACGHHESGATVPFVPAPARMASTADDAKSAESAPSDYRYLAQTHSGACRPLPSWGLSGRAARRPVYLTPPAPPPEP